MGPSIIVLGASGNVGPSVIAELLNQRSKFSRIAILSDPAKVDKFSDAKAKGVEIVAGSFLDSSSFKGFDIVVSLLGAAVFDQQSAIIDAAIAGGATHFYPSEIGLDVAKPFFETQKYFGTKLAVRSHLDEAVTKNSNFGYTLLVIGMITEFVVVTPLFGVDKEKKAVDFVGEESSKITFTSFPDVARYLVSSLVTASPGARTLRVEGETVTAAKLYSTLSKVQDIPYQVSYTPSAKAQELQDKFESEGNIQMAFIMNLKYAIAEQGWLDENDDGKFDFKPETVEETFTRLAA